MLYAGSDDGVYLIEGVQEPGETTDVKVLDAEQVFRICQLPVIPGLFVTAESGLYYSPDGREWTALSLPEEQVYAVTVNPAGDRLYAGTRPARVFSAEWESGVPTDLSDWEELPGFTELQEQADWGIPRHDGLAQVRSLRTHPDVPDRIVAGIEVGGVHVSDDRGATWMNRSIEEFDAPHTDDIHHLALGDGGTFVASTGSGLYRTTDAGRTWDRLDEDQRQRYFRESIVYDGVVYAGGAPASSSSWEEDTEHALFECHDGRALEAVSTPAPEEVALGWCLIDGDPVTVTHRGTLLRRTDGDWREIGTVPTPGGVRGRYFPLSWYEG